MSLLFRKSIPIEELVQYMTRWEESAPDIVHLEIIGKSGSHPILAAFFTDPAYKDEEKEIALITAQHSGMEITGMNTVLSLGNYLASGASEAREILRKQLVVLVPCSNPYSYEKQSGDYQFRNEFGIDEYVALGCEGVKEPEKAPAAVAIQALIDRLCPELLLDFHGVWFEKQTTVETLGYSAFMMNRMHDRRFCDEVQQAAADKGYAVFSEDWMQKTIPSDELCLSTKYRRRFRSGAKGGVSTVYAYLHYHTLSATAEVSWEESGFIRALKALQLGCKGYPVNTIDCPIGHHSLCVGGDTAARRRENRVRLWQNADKISTGLILPEWIGVAGLLISTSKDRMSRLFAEKSSGVSVDVLLEMLEHELSMDTTGLKAFFDEHPNQCIALENLQENSEAMSMSGMCLSIAVPFSDAVPKKVLLNGRTLLPQEYTTHIVENMFYVNITLPEDYAFDLAFAIFDYDCTPPQEGILEF